MASRSFELLIAYLDAREALLQARNRPGSGPTEFSAAVVAKNAAEAELRNVLKAEREAGQFQGLTIDAIKPAWLELCDAADAVVDDMSKHGQDPEAPVVARLRDAVLRMRTLASS